MQLNIEPDLGIELPENPAPLSDFKEKAEAACATAEMLELDVEPTLEDTQEAEKAVLGIAENPEKGNKKALTQLILSLFLPGQSSQTGPSC